jgi:hypothetical protein
MIKIFGDNDMIYGLIIVKSVKKSLVLNYGFSHATFETLNHVFAHISLDLLIGIWYKLTISL